MSPIDHNTLLSEHRSGYRYSKEQSREKRGPGWMIPVTIIASLFTAGAVHAAPVTWGPVTNVSGPSDVLTNGTYVDSATCRAADLTVNGIPFNRYAGDGAAVTPSTILGSGNYDLHFANGSNIIMAFDKGPRANGAASFGPRNTDYDKLLSATDYSGANNRVLSLGGLTVGRSYQVQIWSAYYEGGPYGFSIAGNSFTMNTTAAQFVVGTFTADAVRQDLSITTNPSYTFLPGAVSLRDLTPPTPPASSAWTNSAGGSWPTTTNWQDGVPANGIDATADFGTLTLSGNTTVALDGARTIGSLVFGDVGNQFNWIVNVGTGGPLTLAAAGTPTITVNNQTATISAMLAGGSGLTKAGPGRLILTGTNNYPGDTTVNAGTLQLGDGSTANGAIAGNIINDATMIFANPSQYKYLSMVSGSGTLVKQGAGLLWFGRSTPWAYAGAVDVQLGTFRPTDNYHPATMTSVNVAAGATLDHYYASFSIDALTGAGNITDSGNNNQTLTLGASGGTSLFGGVMNNNLKLVKAGGGTATLTGANIYTGTTTVNNGTLLVNGSLASGSAVTVAGGTLGGTGTIGGTVVCDATLAPGDSSPGILTIDNALTLNAGSTSYFRLNKGGVSDQIAGTGNVTYDGTLTVVANPGSQPFAAGDSFVLFTKTSVPASAFAVVNLPTLDASLKWVNTLDVNGAISVAYANQAAAPVFSPGAGNYVGAQSVTITCADSGSTIYYTTDGSDPRVSGTRIIGASPLSGVEVPVNSANLTLNAYATKSGMADSAPASAVYNTVATPTWINPAGGSWTTSSNWLHHVVANGTDLTADFSGLTLTGHNTVTLDSQPTLGQLVFGDLGNQFNWIVNAGSGGPLTLAAAGTPTITVNNQTATISAMLAGGSGLTKAGPGRLILTGTNNYPGDTTVNAGTLQLGDGSTANGAIAGNIINDATMIFANPSQYKYLSMVSGSGTLVKQGAGLLWFGRSTPWAYAGAVDVQLGTFRPTDNYHPATMTSVNVAAGATLDHYYASFSIDALTGAGNITDSGNNNQTLTLGASGGTSLFGGVMNNNLKLVKAGGGTATLTGANTYTGNTTVSDGTLELAATGHLKFVPTTNGASNKLTGTGTVNLKGIFDIDLSGAATATGNSWTLVDVGSLTANYDSTSFSVTGFTDPEDDGTWTKTVDANTTWTFTESTGILTYTVTTPAGFGSWISDLAFGLAPADQDPTDDPDNDGLNNLLEYALGGTPNVNDAATIAPTGGPDGLGNYVFHYKRLDLSKTDTQQTVEWSDNLEDWTPIPIPLATAAPVTVTENGTAPDDITVTIATGGALKIFARLKVVTTP